MGASWLLRAISIHWNNCHIGINNWYCNTVTRCGSEIQLVDFANKPLRTLMQWEACHCPRMESVSFQTKVQRIDAQIMDHYSSLPARFSWPAQLNWIVCSPWHSSLLIIGTRMVVEHFYIVQPLMDAQPKCGWFNCRCADRLNINNAFHTWKFKNKRYQWILMNTLLITYWAPLRILYPTLCNVQLLHCLKDEHCISKDTFERNFRKASCTRFGPASIIVGVSADFVWR